MTFEGGLAHVFFLRKMYIHEFDLLNLDHWDLKVNISLGDFAPCLDVVCKLTTESHMQKWNLTRVFNESDIDQVKISLDLLVSYAQMHCKKQRNKM